MVLIKKSQKNPFFSCPSCIIYYWIDKQRFESSRHPIFLFGCVFNRIFLPHWSAEDIGKELVLCSRSPLVKRSFRRCMHQSTSICLKKVPVKDFLLFLELRTTSFRFLDVCSLLTSFWQMFRNRPQKDPSIIHRPKCQKGKFQIGNVLINRFGENQEVAAKFLCSLSVLILYCEQRS